MRRFLLIRARRELVTRKKIIRYNGHLMRNALNIGVMYTKRLAAMKKKGDMHFKNKCWSWFRQSYMEMMKWRRKWRNMKRFRRNRLMRRVFTGQYSILLIILHVISHIFFEFYTHRCIVLVTYLFLR